MVNKALLKRIASHWGNNLVLEVCLSLTAVSRPSWWVVWGGGSCGVGVLPLNHHINLFCSMLVTFLFLRNDTVCLDSILILYADSNNIMFYTEPWGFLFYS